MQVDNPSNSNFVSSEHAYSGVSTLPLSSIYVNLNLVSKTSFKQRVQVLKSNSSALKKDFESLGTNLFSFNGLDENLSYLEGRAISNNVAEQDEELINTVENDLGVLDRFIKYKLYKTRINRILTVILMFPLISAAYVLCKK